MAAKLLNLLAVTSLAIVACSFGAAPANALSTETHNNAAHLARGHDAMAKRKRSAKSKRCKVKPASSSLVANVTPSTSEAAPASTSKEPEPPKTTSTKASVTQAPTPAPSPVSNGAAVKGSRKVCIAWPNGNDIPIAPYKGSKSGWTYTWSPWKPQNAAALGLNPVPMLWGDKQVGDFTKLVKAGYADHVLGMNEPNEPGQANISPQHGADLWRQHIQPLASKGYTLISPACTSGPSGKTWMRDFFKACNGCTVDRIALHWYGTDANELIKYVEDFYKEFKLPIWLTEFACQDFSGKDNQCTEDQIWSFANKVVGFLDSSSSVEAYCPFGAMHDMFNVNPLNQLMKPDNTPTKLGKLYFGA